MPRDRRGGGAGAHPRLPRSVALENARRLEHDQSTTEHINERNRSVVGPRRGVLSSRRAERCALGNRYYRAGPSWVYRDRVVARKSRDLGRKRRRARSGPETHTHTPRWRVLDGRRGISNRVQSIRLERLDRSDRKRATHGAPKVGRRSPSILTSDQRARARTGLHTRPVASAAQQKILKTGNNTIHTTGNNRHFSRQWAHAAIARRPRGRDCPRTSAHARARAVAVASGPPRNARAPATKPGKKKKTGGKQNLQVTKQNINYSLYVIYPTVIYAKCRCHEEQCKSKIKQGSPAASSRDRSLPSWRTGRRTQTTRIAIVMSACRRCERPRRDRERRQRGRARLADRSTAPIGRRSRRSARRRSRRRGRARGFSQIKTRSQRRI